MSIFKAYDIRGIYGEGLNEKEAFLIGYYLAKKLNLKKFKVAHDLRLSYQELTKFFLRGLIEAGCSPIYLGALSTPNFYFSLFDEINSGVVITASHNSSKYNGFKIIYNLESFDSRNGLYELRDLVSLDEDKKINTFNNLFHEIKLINLEDFLNKFDIEKEEYLEKYITYLESYAKNLFNEKDFEILRNRRFGYCFSSGMTSQVMVPLIKKLGFNHIFHLEKPDGGFPQYDPEPSKAQKYIIDYIDGVEGTFAYDGDGDRLVFYDEEEMFVLEDFLILSLIDYFKEENSSFVVDLRASKTIFDFSKNNSLKIEKMRVGRAFYQNYMKDNDCIFGAELSGHLFFRDFNYLDNPDIATLIFLKIVSQKFIHNSKFRVSELFDSYKTYFKLKEKNIKVLNKEESFEKLKEKYEQNLTSQKDGLSFDLEEFWFNVRASNTEPVLRINLEAKTQNVANNELENLVKFLQN